MKSTTIAILVAAVPFLGLVSYGVWDQTRTHPTPKATSIGYEPQVGDIVFQSLPYHELTAAIEGITRSPLSHCGIVALDRGRWVVVEAIGSVIETPLELWISRGRDRKVSVYRFDGDLNQHIPAIVASAREYLGRPYDTRYRMDDESIYCSELVFKAVQQATGKDVGSMSRLGDMNWKTYEKTIRKYEGGDPPLDRMMITPFDLTESKSVVKVFDNGI